MEIRRWTFCIVHCLTYDIVSKLARFFFQSMFFLQQVALQLVLYGWMAYMLWVLVTIAVVTVDRGIQNGLTMKSYPSRRRNHADLVDTNSTEYRVSSMYTYMAHYKIRHESFAMLCLLVLGASTTLPWPLVELFHIFRHVRGTKPATASLVSLRLVLQVKKICQHFFFLVQKP